MRRPSTILAFLFVVLALASPGKAADPEGEFFAKINQERASAGLSSLSVDPPLLDVARRHSARMAEAGRIFHNDNLPNEVDGWVLLGENVGRGADVQSLHDAFMASPDHRAQILEERYRAGAVGVVESQGTIWVTELFIKRAEAPPAPAPAEVTRPARRSTPRPKLVGRNTQPAPPPAEPTVEAAVFPERHALVGLSLAQEKSIGSVVLALPLLDVDLQTSHPPDPLIIIATTMLVLAAGGLCLRRFAAT